MNNKTLQATRSRVSRPSTNTHPTMSFDRKPPSIVYGLGTERGLVNLGIFQKLPKKITESFLITDEIMAFASGNQ